MASTGIVYSVMMHRRRFLHVVTTTIALSFVLVCGGCFCEAQQHHDGVKTWHRERRLDTIVTATLETSINITATEQPKAVEPVTSEPKPTGETQGTQVIATNDESNKGSIPPKETVKDPCATSNSCEECKTLASTLTKEGYTCLWEKESCRQLDLNTNNNNNDMCAASESQLNDSESSSMGTGGVLVGMVVIVLVAVGLVLLRWKLMGASTESVAKDFGNIFNPSMKKKASLGRMSETVPLANAATDDDEEWGWEDSTAGGGDVELSNASLRGKDDDEDLIKALAMEKSTPIPKFAIPPRKHVSDSPSTRLSKNRPPPSPPSFPLADPSIMPMQMQITSLGQQAAKPNRTARPKKASPEDDLFASMGLASKPTFAKPSAAKSSASASSWKNPTMAESVDSGEHWDDDGDLDDLLND